jgi:hypothetical protein
MNVETIHSTQFIEEVIQHNVNKNLIRYNLFMKSIMDQSEYLLEKELDKTMIDFDLSLTDLHNDSENGDLIEENLIDFIDSSREKLKTIGNVWSQLVHKAQTIFQVNCKLEAQLVNLKSDKVEAIAFKKAS